MYIEVYGLLTEPIWIFDLDDTLHNASRRIFPFISAQMNRYMEEQLGLDAETARQLRIRYWHRYGATLKGLTLHHGVEAAHFLRETHPVSEMLPWLEWEKSLADTLRRLPGKKVLFSNGPIHYVDALTEHMRISRHFHARYGMESVRLLPKPALRSFRRVLSKEGLNPARCVMVEDSLPNLVAAKRLGMKTVWLSTQCRLPAYVDHRIGKIRDLLRL